MVGLISSSNRMIRRLVWDESAKSFFYQSKSHPECRLFLGVLVDVGTNDTYHSLVGEVVSDDSEIYHEMIILHCLISE